MTLVHRRIIYLFFMAVFFIVLPFIIMSATGYRFNTKKNIIQKTGIIFLEARPEKVDIWLNGKLIDNRTPVRINNLLPNEYELKLTKEGYHSWQKKIRVYESQTTSLQYIRLFKKNIKADNLVAEKIIKMVKLDGRDKLLLIKYIDNQYVVSIFKKGEEKEIYKSGKEIIKAEWADNGERVIIYQKNNIYIINVNNPDKVINLQDKLGSVDFASLKFDKFNSNNVFYIKHNKLIKVNLLNLNKTVFPYWPLDYYVQGNTIYFLSQNSLNNIFLKKFDILNAGASETLFVLELADNYRLVDAQNEFVTIKKGNELIIWDGRRGKSEVIKGVDFFKWNANHDELLFGNKRELWTYRPQKEEKYILFTRTGGGIKNAEWYKPETHIFYIVNNKLKVVENLVSNRVVYDMAEFKEMDDFSINEKGDKVYIIGRDNQKQGLFELKILDN